MTASTVSPCRRLVCECIALLVFRWDEPRGASETADPEDPPQYLTSPSRMPWTLHSTEESRGNSSGQREGRSCGPRPGAWGGEHMPCCYRKATSPWARWSRGEARHLCNPPPCGCLLGCASLHDRQVGAGAGCPVPVSLPLSSGWSRTLHCVCSFPVLSDCLSYTAHNQRACL